MAVTSVSPTNPYQSSSDAVYNPNSQLTNDQFMQLFLTELQYQDPTDPMDTDKMLEQTAYLSTMEMNKNMQDTLNNLSSTLSTSQQFSTINAIGKMGDLGIRTINVTDNDASKTFELYFGDNITSGEVQIKDKNGNIVVVTLNEKIKNLALNTNGAYMKYSLKKDDIKLLAQTIQNQFKAKKESQNTINDTRELFYIPLALSILFTFMAIFGLINKANKTNQ